jgi:chromosome segregation ATPase
VEAQEENQDLPAGECDTRTPADDPLELGSAGETPEPCEIQTTPADVEQASQASGTMVQQMLQGFFESIKSDLNSNQTNLRLDLQSNQAKLDQFQNSVKSDLNSLRSELGEVRSDLTQVKSDLQAHQEQVRADIQAENQKLLRNFEAQTQDLRKEFNHKIESETRRVSQLVSQVQSETTTEFIAGDKH